MQTLNHSSAYRMQQAMTLEQIEVEVAYALPDRQVLISLNVALGTTLQDAVQQSGILLQFKDIDLTINKVGIFGTLCELNTILRHKDRIEIYRPLLISPKEMRRQRILAAKSKRTHVQ